MWGLEYAMLFGLPKNKLELIDGRTRCVFPFHTREEGEAHLDDWTETLCRWKKITAKPALRKGRTKWRTRLQQFELTLYPLPIELRIPLDGEALWTLDSSFWRRDLWEQQPSGRETGWEDRQRHYDVHLNLWTLFGEWCQRYGGNHIGRVDVSLSDNTTAAPDQYYFPADAEECLQDDYFWGVPKLIAEVLSPATRAIDRGPRKNLYRRAGVPHLWLLDPESETVELYDLVDGDYRLEATYGAGQEFRPALFSEETVAVDRFFDTQWKRHRKRHPEWFGREEEEESVGEWLVAPEKRLGLEYLFLVGHPERRYEIWNNRAPCVLAFGSATEARTRLAHFLEEAACWEQVNPSYPAHTFSIRLEEAAFWEQAPPSPSALLKVDIEQAEVGRFRFTRYGRHVQLDVAIEARKYQELLRVWSDRAAWDWGEK